MREQRCDTHTCVRASTHTQRQTTAVRNCNIMMQWVQHAIFTPKIRIFLATCKYIKIWLMFTCGCLFLYFNVLRCVFYKLQNNVFFPVLPLAQVTAPKPGFWFQIHILTMATYIYLSHLSLFTASPDYACKQSDNLAAAPQLICCYYSSALGKKTVLLGSRLSGPDRSNASESNRWCVWLTE